MIGQLHAVTQMTRGNVRLDAFTEKWSKPLPTRTSPLRVHDRAAGAQTATAYTKTQLGLAGAVPGVGGCHTVCCWRLTGLCQAVGCGQPRQSAAHHHHVRLHVFRQLGVAAGPQQVLAPAAAVLAGDLRQQAVRACACGLSADREPQHF